MTADDTGQPARSTTALILDDLQLFGYRPFADEPDPRPLPTPTPSRARLPMSSTPSSRHSPTPASSPTSKTCSGR